jgi:hypothetical protein
MRAGFALTCPAVSAVMIVVARYWLFRALRPRLDRAGDRRTPGRAPPMPPGLR